MIQFLKKIIGFFTLSDIEDRRNAGLASDKMHTQLARVAAADKEFYEMFAASVDAKGVAFDTESRIGGLYPEMSSTIPTPETRNVGTSPAFGAPYGRKPDPLRPSRKAGPNFNGTTLDTQVSGGGKYMIATLLSELKIADKIHNMSLEQTPLAVAEIQRLRAVEFRSATEKDELQHKIKELRRETTEARTSSAQAFATLHEIGKALEMPTSSHSRYKLSDTPSWLDKIRELQSRPPVLPDVTPREIAYRQGLSIIQRELGLGDDAIDAHSIPVMVVEIRNFKNLILDANSGGVEEVKQVNAHKPETTDEHCINQFAEVMKTKMWNTSNEGRNGWEQCTAEDLHTQMYACVCKGDPVDVANYCMMLYHRGIGTSSGKWHMVATAIDIEAMSNIHDTTSVVIRDVVAEINTARANWLLLKLKL